MSDESPPPPAPPAQAAEKSQPAEQAAGSWGGWGLSIFSEISRNAVEVAKSAMADIQQPPEQESGPEKEDKEKEPEGEEEERRKAALEKLEKASEDSILGQASTCRATRCYQGELPAKASAIAPTILETGKSFTARGMEVLERVGKETMEFIVEETGMEVDKGSTGEGDQQTEEEQFEEVSFDRCFYIYGGPDQLEVVICFPKELEALSSHYALLFNRKKGKLNAEQKTYYDGKLKEIQQILSLSTNSEEDGSDSDKGKKIESADTDTDAEMKKLCETSVSKAAKMAAGFTTALGGLSPNDIIKRTTNRLETLHSEGVHAQSISVDMEKVSSSFATGISDVAEAYAAAIQNALADKQDDLPNQKSVQEKAKSISSHLNSDQTSAVGKLQDALQYLAYVVICASMPSA
ncbi:hypothetical protein HU200_047827 [Digitaria exilis]|uniref:DUF7798 domain-containing protein n=1 Tax=Digitaria exilis TaxID=1010633 RepID=A0A835AXM1_9POAL|nr:hypothetical protein HU200_047827 [Digitaria exilis]